MNGVINQWEAPVIVSLLDLGRSPGVHHEPGMVPLKSLVRDVGFVGISWYKCGPRKLAQKYIWSVHGSAGLCYLVKPCVMRVIRIYSPEIRLPTNLRKKMP